MALTPKSHDFDFGHGFLNVNFPASLYLMPSFLVGQVIQHDSLEVVKLSSKKLITLKKSSSKNCLVGSAMQLDVEANYPKCVNIFRQCVLHFGLPWCKPKYGS